MAIPPAAVTAGGAAVLALALLAGQPGPSGGADAAILAAGEAFAWTCYAAAAGVPGYATWALVRGLAR